jgi:hypothetical protein
MNSQSGVVKSTAGRPLYRPIFGWRCPNMSSRGWKYFRDIMQQKTKIQYITNTGKVKIENILAEVPNSEDM